ncbi:hypothetical protein [Brevibacillus sp. 179-C9.3 HS]
MKQVLVKLLMVGVSVSAIVVYIYGWAWDTLGEKKEDSEVIINRL